MYPFAKIRKHVVEIHFCGQTAKRLTNDLGNLDFNKPTVILARQFLSSLDVLLDGDPNVREGFFFSCSL